MTKRDDASCVAAPVPPARERRGNEATKTNRFYSGRFWYVVRSSQVVGKRGLLSNRREGNLRKFTQFLILSLRARLGKLSLGDLRSPRPESHSCSIIRKGAKSNSWSWSWSAEKGDSVFGTSVVVAVSSHRTHRRPYDVRA